MPRGGCSRPAQQEERALSHDMVEKQPGKKVSPCPPLPPPHSPPPAPPSPLLLPSPCSPPLLLPLLIFPLPSCSCSPSPCSLEGRALSPGGRGACVGLWHVQSGAVLGRVYLFAFRWAAAAPFLLSMCVTHHSSHQF